MEKVNTIGKLFLKRLNTSPKNNSIGWIENNQIQFFSFQSYFDAIECFAIGLKEIGFQKNNRFAILSRTCKEWHLTDYSVLCLQGVVIPIYPTYTCKEISFIFNHSEAEFLAIENLSLFSTIANNIQNLKSLKAIIFFCSIDERVKEKIPTNIQVYTFKEISQKGVEEVKNQPNFFTNSIQSQEASDIATIIYTSGTTDTPKGAVINHQAFITMLNNLNIGTEHAFSEKDRSLIFLPLSHVLGRCDSYLCTLFGWEMVFAESVDRVLNNILLVKPTIMIAVPRIFEKIHAKILIKLEESTFIKKGLFKWALKASENYFNKLDTDKVPSSFDITQKDLAYNLVFKKIYNMLGGRIRFFVTGGAPLSEEIIKFLRIANLSVLEGYGLTETVGPCTLNPLYKQLPGTVGKPIGDVQIKIAKDGEVLVKTKALFTQYYKDEQSTAEAMEDEWFKTGDIGEITPHGHLKITDRKKDIIITSGGKNISPQKIENLMKLQKYTSHFIVVGDKRSYLTGLVGIEKENFLDILDKLGLEASSSISQIALNEHVFALIQNEINEVNSHLAQFEAIKKFQILPVELTTYNYLTPSLKVRKKVLLNEYATLIEQMY